MHDKLHHQVMKALRGFMDEDDMDFDEAAEAAADRRKFLLNRILRRKVLPNEESDDDEEEQEGEANKDNP